MNLINEKVKAMGKHLCPVCGKFEFSERDSFEICHVCGWEDDDLQLTEPDYAGGANRISLNEYRRIWQEKNKGAEGHAK